MLVDAAQVDLPAAPGEVTSEDKAALPIIFPVDKLQSALYPQQATSASQAQTSSEPEAAHFSQATSQADPQAAEESKPEGASPEINPQTADALRDAYQQADAVGEEVAGEGPGEQEVEEATASESTAEALRYQRACTSECLRYVGGHMPASQLFSALLHLVSGFSVSRSEHCWGHNDVRDSAACIHMSALPRLFAIARCLQLAGRQRCSRCRSTLCHCTS